MESSCEERERERGTDVHCTYMYVCTYSVCICIIMEPSHSKQELNRCVQCKYRKVRPLSVGGLFQPPPGSGAHLSHEISHVIGTASQVGLQ